MIRGKPSFVKMQYLLGGDCLWLGLPVTRDEGFSVFAISDASVSSLADALCSLIECSPTWDWLGLCLSNDFWLIKKQSCFNKTKQTFLKCIIFHHPLPVLGPNGPEILRHARTNFEVGLILWWNIKKYYIALIHIVMS